MLASFKTFRGGFGELLVEISFPRSDEVLCTTFPEDLPCAHSQKFVGMVDLVVMCLGEGTDQNLGVLWKDDFIWVCIVEIHGHDPGIGDDDLC